MTGLMIANAIYDLLPIPTETLIVAGILVGLGLGYLFPGHDNEKNKHHNHPSNGWFDQGL
ncbi:hypothetical protein [Streptococcus vestibularis]|uniref:hypothetical protein n=2 Tax=Streptococcus vestibularis TaxID=1343 RepID=UPI003873B69C